MGARRKADAAFTDIESWARWFIAAHEETLRDNPDIQTHAALRAQVRAIADARVAEVRADERRRRSQP
jgi:hypothetical protein